MAVWTLLCWHRFACWLSDEPFELELVDLAYPEPPSSHEYHRLFGCRCRFGKKMNVLSFDAQHKELRNCRTWRDVSKFVQGTPGIFLATPTSDLKFIQKVERLVVSQDAPWIRFHSIAEVAERLQMTSQTLRRRLRAEGASFRSIKNYVRSNYALELLDDNDLTVFEIAERIGYGEASGFSRAFKIWFGLSPEAYKERLSDNR